MRYCSDNIVEKETVLERMTEKEFQAAGPAKVKLRSPSLSLQWCAPNSPPKVPLPVDRSPNPITCLIPGPVRPTMPNGIRIQSAIFPQCTAQTDAPTDGCIDQLTDRPRKSLIIIGCCATTATQPNNTQIFMMQSRTHCLHTSALSTNYQPSNVN